MDMDSEFFARHPDRYAHIRKPGLELGRNQQRWIGYVDECDNEFRTLGEHKRDRRRIILWRVPRDNCYYDPDKPQILKIPFLLFGDETVEDTDEVLLPIVHEIMVDAAKDENLI
jgi:hypothetical protein